MPLTRIEKTQWRPFFDRVSAALGAKTVDMDIVGPGVGSQTEARHVVLTGLSYDSKDDIFAVIGEDLEHNISHPQQINVDGELDAVRSLEVVDASGDHHIITLTDPLPLPPPA
jgi:Family of unknown function (DUF5335)